MRRTRIAALTAAGALVAAGSGVAVATTSSRSDDPEQRERALLSDAADRLDVEPAELRDALSDAQAAQLDADVEAGRLTRAAADAIEKARREAGTVLGPPGGRAVARELFPGGPGGVHLGAPDEVLRAHGGGPLDTAAEALGISRADLFERLRDGKSLEDVAKAQGKSIDDVKAAMRAGIRKDLDDAVDAGKLTAAEADRMADKMTEGADHVPAVKLRAPDGPPEPMLFGP